MRNQEEAMKIMEALSGVDVELLARCEAAGAGADAGIKTVRSQEETASCTNRKKRQGGSAWKYLSRCAAVLALAAVGVVSWRGLRISEDMAINESASGGSPETTARDFCLDLELADGISEDGNSGDGLPESMISESKFAGKEVPGGKQETMPLPTAAGAGLNGTNRTEASDEIEFQGSKDGSESVAGVNTEDCLVSAVQMLTAEEAGQIDLLGDYVPATPPEDYVFESARYEAQTGRLTICWRRGMDDIRLSFEETDGAEVETADIQKPETYDERLYEIPFADSVPEEYRETFLAPVFAKDDFSLEIVRSRVLSYSGDSGDTSTPRGQFSVLYDDVLVHFNGRGTPEEIWEMFVSISK